MPFATKRILVCVFLTRYQTTGLKPNEVTAGFTMLISHRIQMHFCGRRWLTQNFSLPHSETRKMGPFLTSTLAPYGRSWTTVPKSIVTWLSSHSLLQVKLHE